MKVRYFDRHKHDKSLWQLNWLGKKEFFKIFKSHGLDANGYYTHEEIEEISAIIFSEALKTTMFEDDDSSQSMANMDAHVIRKMFKALLAGNADHYENLKDRFI